MTTQFQLALRVKGLIHSFPLYSFIEWTEANLSYYVIKCLPAENGGNHDKSVTITSFRDKIQTRYLSITKQNCFQHSDAKFYIVLLQRS